MKKLVFAMMMTALMLGSVVSTVSADPPWPGCYPCDEAVASSK